MIGQKSLLNKLTEYTLDTFPRSILLLGEAGMGKHTLAQYISNEILRLPIEDISESLCDELLEAIYRRPLPQIYLIDISQMDAKKQNTLLKFVEEPGPGVFIVLLAVNEVQVLDTVLNRCVKFNLLPYSREELQVFLPAGVAVDLALDSLRTPGKIKTCNLALLQDTADYAEKIATKISAASFANTLSITSKINFKDEYDKFDLDILLDMLVNSLFKRYSVTGDLTIYAMYKLLVERKKTLLDNRINKESFIESLLTDLWLLARSDHDE